MARYGVRMAAPRVLLVGFDPHSVPGVDAQLVELALAMGEEHLALFERIVNLSRVLAPQAAIAFNSTGADSLDAVRRWIDEGHLPRSG